VDEGAVHDLGIALPRDDLVGPERACDSMHGDRGGRSEHRIAAFCDLGQRFERALGRSHEPRGADRREPGRERGLVVEPLEHRAVAEAVDHPRELERILTVQRGEGIGRLRGPAPREGEGSEQGRESEGVGPHRAGAIGTRGASLDPKRGPTKPRIARAARAERGSSPGPAFRDARIVQLTPR
jgi:hypothetical protein